ncbi:hypothetical protein CR203_18245 [Salipaludibacillus neizhouensis]|uniref:Uncharacterized protein n=1 Tax=Salipaludibacillus neizhouensis TaxID=885475 RepID=A0A3A9K827_9BACI|nr:hypothetical protein [Salipaludibacillus neizhouensis]RKL65803.1 hypothetical protein CR203_18245 [Salipaludibacillus neizhouensis]
MESVETLKPIEKKIQQWMYYENNKPKVPYKGNEKLHDNFRKENDLDCQLTDGNLEADTIISLWLPLRFSLVRLNQYPFLKKIGNINNKMAFLNEFIKHDLEEFLPVNEPIVVKLSELFRRGMKRENVMILPNRRINCERSAKPYFDYVPHFLHDCFQGGYFGKYFSNDNELDKWIEEENLKMFFENEEKSKFMLKDLSGSGSVKNNRHEKVETMLDNYICVLKARGRAESV